MKQAAERQNPSLAGTQPEHNAAASFVNDRYLKLATNAKNWRLGFCALLLVAGGLAGGVVYVASRQQGLPSVVEVDEAGSARVIAELRATTVHDPVVVQALLRKWLQDIRTLTTDPEVNHRRTQEAYALALEPAPQVIAASYRETPPAELLKGGQRFPVKITLQPVSPRTWRARWQDHRVDQDGPVREEGGWEATIAIALVVPTTREERQRSPLGLWMATLPWAPLSRRCVMSRYDIPAKHAHHTCVVGYDPPLGTFFGQVSRVKKGQPQPRVVLWVGTDLHELPTIADLAQAIQDYAVIPADIWQQLETDCQTVGFRPNFGTWLLAHLHRDREDAR
jgi:type IV secretory pathway TrbF-like protein